ncbi:MAG: enoyl-CoA hydratase/isomerase family protein [bacterium]|nr:enoyl-CoA hydratase [Deltaproteobacteria bacterium]MCP4906211.1 enoyl-CoA hydratase/isomerase family protein [bacterium]
MSDCLLIESRGPIRVVRMNRPEQLNAASPELHRRLSEVWTELAADPEARAVVITGQGKAFSAGGDLDLIKEMGEDFALRRTIMQEAKAIVRGLVDFPLPLVAAVNGPAVGLGCSLVSLSDVVFMSETAFLADPHVTVGLVAGDGGAVTFPLMMSLLKAKEFLLTGDRIPAADALRLGLANRVVKPEDLFDEAFAFAERLAAQPRRAVEGTKRTLNLHLSRALSGILDFAISTESESFDCPDHRTAVEAMTKR